MSQMRSPICTVMGHVDHGKSSLLDFIRNTNIVAREAGAITQAIGASVVPIDTIKVLCSKCVKDTKIFTVPGLLFIDTPGHAAFTNLRKRGGNLADIAILVVDINEGLMPQTIEAIQILKQYKTPFVIAANKIDLINGYKSNPQDPVLGNIAKQSYDITQKIETKMYEIVGLVSEQGFNAERYDRLESYTKQIAIVPISAKTGEGIPELLMVVAGLAQKYLEQSLKFDVSSQAKGTILEVKEEQGIGISLDVIIYEGTIKVGDTIVVGTTNEPIVTKVRCLFEPAPQSEMRDKKSKFKPVKQVYAATGVKISGPNLEGAMSGMPIAVADDKNVEEIKARIKAEIEEVTFEGDEQGLCVKADSLGSLEALVKILKDEGFNIRKASVGEVNKKDISEAESNLENNPLDCVILGFNINTVEDKNVKVLTSNIIYSLIDQFKAWRIEKKNAIEMSKVDGVSKPVKLEFLKNHTFRQSNPAIIGVEVIAGTLKPGLTIMSRDGKPLATLKQVQKDGASVKSAEKGDKVAISLEGVTVGRQIQEGDLFYSALNESEFNKYKEVKDLIKGDEKALLKEIAEIMRRENPVWGV
jgi:translation initiation factor 5B